LAFQYWIDPAESRVFVTATRRATSAESTQFLDALTADPAYRPGFDVVYDRRAVSEPEEDEAVQAMVDYLAVHPDRFVGSRWAIVVAPDVRSARASLTFADLIDLAARIEVRVFLRMNEAIAWLADAMDRQ
jgi:hypothetical protein